MIETNKIINGDCIEVMKTFPEGCIDLICTSPPYGVGIAYDTHDDDVEFQDYVVFARNWLTEAYNVLKDDGRIALNIPYEINRQKKGGRIFFVSEMYQIMKEIGFGFFGIVDLEEQSPHRSKTTAWGSWMSPSSPYIYNPKECVILAYKKHHIKKVKGEPQWKGVPTEIENEDGTKGADVDFMDQADTTYMGVAIEGYTNWKKFLEFHREMGIDFGTILNDKFDEIWTKEFTTEFVKDIVF
jgi:DNA modification methylase